MSDAPHKAREAARAFLEVLDCQGVSDGQLSAFILYSDLWLPLVAALEVIDPGLVGELPADTRTIAHQREEAKQ